MLTSLDFLSKGEAWPPRQERERLRMYEANRLLFEGRHGEVYGSYAARVKRTDADGNDIVSFMTALNYFRLMTLKLGDLLGTPELKAGLKTGERAAPQSREDAVWDIVNAGLKPLVTQAAYDMSRYGDAVLLVCRDDETGNGKLELARPEIWFPVVEPDNIKSFTRHVLAWTYGEGEGYGKNTFLKCELHAKGEYERRLYRMNAQAIGELLEVKRFCTGLPDFAVIPLQNILTSDRVHGLDDYSGIDSIVSELETRVAQVAKVLDKHTEPSMQGPECALERDKLGEYRLKLGEYFINQGEGDEKAGDVKYLTWDAHMDANFKFIEVLRGSLYTLSEMGSALLGDLSQHAGQIPSGSALKRLLYSPLAKVGRMRAELDAKLKRAVTLCALYYGEDMSGAPPSLRWPDPLPADPVEQASIMSVRTGGLATISQRSAVKAIDGVDEEEAEAEVERIKN